jgi:hypothetical protein
MEPVEANSGRRRYEVKEEPEITEEQYEVVTSWAQVSTLGNEVILLILTLIFTILRASTKRLLIQARRLEPRNENGGLERKSVSFQVKRRRVLGNEIRKETGEHEKNRKLAKKGEPATKEQQTTVRTVRTDPQKSENKQATRPVRTEHTERTFNKKHQTKQQQYPGVEYGDSGDEGSCSERRLSHNREGIGTQLKRSMSDRETKRKSSGSSDFFSKKQRPQSVSGANSLAESSKEQPKRDLSTTRSTTISLDVATPQSEGQSPVFENMPEDKIIVVASTPLLLPGQPGAPWFQGENISTFLERYSDLCDDYKVSKEMKRERIIRYVHPWYKDTITAMPEYAEVGYDEGKFYKALKEEYKDNDWETLRFSREFLEQTVEKAKSGRLTSKAYVDLFDRISKVLIDRGELDETQRAREFMKGLNSTTKDKIFRDTEFEPSNVRTHDYDKMHKTAVKAYEVEEKRRRYNEYNDPDYSKIKQAHLDEVVDDLLPKRNQEHVLPFPPPMPIPKTSGGLVEEHKGQAAPATARIPKAKQPGLSEIDKLTEEMAKLKVHAVTQDTLNSAMDNLGKTITNKVESLMLSQQPSSNQYGQSSGYSQSNGFGQRGGFQQRGRGRGNGFRGGYGGYGGYSGHSGSGGGGYGNGGYQNSGQTEGGAVQGNSLEFVGNANAVGFQPTDEKCPGCYGRTIDGVEDPEYEDHRAYDCPLMWHLVERGCIHRFRTQWYQGLLKPGVKAAPLFFSRDRRWFDQARAIVQGGEFDYNINARPANLRRMEEEARLATQERAKATGTQGNQVAPLSIVQRNQGGGMTRDNDGTVISGGFEAGGRQFQFNLPDGSKPEDWYEALPTSVSVNAVSNTATASKKAKAAEGAKQTLRRQARAEERAPRARPRDEAGDFRQVEDVTDEMEVDPDQDTETQATLDNDPEETVKRVMKKKQTVPLPKIDRSKKMIMDTLRTPDPVATFDHQWRKDNASYIQVIEMANVIYGNMLDLMGCKDKLERTLMRPSLLGPTVASVPTLVEGSSLTQEELVESRSVVPSPRLPITFVGPVKKQADTGLIDTGAEVNVLPEQLAREVGCIIRDAKHHAMITADGKKAGFVGAVRIRVEIGEGIGCTDIFFLIRGSDKILLGQPFINRMQMTISYRPDGSMDGRFTDPETGASCTTMMVPKMKEKEEKQVSFKDYEKPTVADESDDLVDDDIEEN